MSLLDGAPEQGWNTLTAVPPTIQEFLIHPDFPQIAAFFLGWLFMASLSVMYSSSLPKTAFRVIRTFFRERLLQSAPHNDVESFPGPHSEKTSSTSSLSRNSGYDTLVFTLSLCSAFASLANVLSLLTFDSREGATACAFVVAWGGMAAQVFRLVGIGILILELRNLGVARWETIVGWFAILIAAALSFATNAVSIGVTSPIYQFGRALCYRRISAGVSLALSIFDICLEFYVILRTLSVLSPPFLSFRHRVACLRDPRFLKGVSLLILDLLTVAPVLAWINVLAQFIPFSLGALIVLFAFSHRPAVSDEQSLHSIPPNSSGPISRHSTRDNISLPPHENFERISQSQESLGHIPQLSIPEGENFLNFPVATTSNITQESNHLNFPIAATSDATGESNRAIEDWTQSGTTRGFRRTLTAQSTISFDSAAVRSITGAVVHVAKYTNLASSRDHAEILTLDGLWPAEPTTKDELRRSTNFIPPLHIPARFHDNEPSVWFAGPATKASRPTSGRAQETDQSVTPTGVTSPDGDHSDIISLYRARTALAKKNPPRTNTSSSRPTPTSSTRSRRRSSWASMPRELFDANGEQKNRTPSQPMELEEYSNDVPLTRRPTFGSTTLRLSEYATASPIVTGLVSPPLSRPSLFRGSMTGPRPPPSASLWSPSKFTYTIPEMSGAAVSYRG